MPILKHAIKKLRVDKKRAEVNKVVRNKARRAVKLVRTSPTADALRSAFSALDRAAKKKVFHKSKANRLKSRLSKLIKGEAKVVTVKKVVKKTVKKVVKK